MIVNNVIPKFHEAYDVGWIGFTYTVGDPISEGIAYFERWERRGDIPVSHAFVVTGENEIVEAHYGTGVRSTSLDAYLADPRVRIYFRRPRMWTEILGRSIANAAIQKMGTPYATGLIAGDLLSSSIVGHWLNVLLKQWPRRFVNHFIVNVGDFICSELAAYALASQREYKGIGVLAERLDSIDPQYLFEDQNLFADFINQVIRSKGVQS